MKLFTIFFLVNILAIGCYAQWVGIASSLTNIVVGLHNWGSGQTYPFMGHNCNANIKGRIHKLKWVWDGKFTCSSWTPLTGNSRGHKSKNGAIHHAVQDFINKALQNNLITQEMVNGIGK